MKHRILVWALGLLVSVPAFSQTIETDRPDQTEAATLVPVGGFQLETGVSGWTSGDGMVTGYTLPTALARYGLHRRFELRIVGQRDQSQYNFIDLTPPWQSSSAWDVGAKFAGWNTDASQMCVLAHYQHRPDGNDGGQVRANWAKSLGRRFSVGTNLGLTWFWATEDEAVVGQMLYTLALGCAVTESLYAYVEAFGAGGGLQADAGLAWKPNPTSQLDASVGWTDGSGQSYVAVGWSKLWMTGRSGR